MANNREISQFAGLVTVNDTTNRVSIGATLVLTGGGSVGIGSDPSDSNNSISAQGSIAGTRLIAANGDQSSADLTLRAHGSGANYGLLENEGNKIAFLGRRANDGAVGTMAEIKNVAEGDLGASWPNAMTFNVRRFGDVYEAVRIGSNGRVGIGSSAPDGLLTIQGNSDESTTPSIRLKDGTDSREVSISNTAGDFVVSTHGSDDAVHGQIKIFELGKIVVNNGGAHGTLTERIGISTEGAVGLQRPFFYLDGQYFVGDNTFTTIAQWTNGGNQGGAASMLIMVSNHTGVTGGKCGLWKQHIHYDGTLGTLTAIDAGGITLDTQISGGNFQVKGWDGGTGLSTAMRISIIFNDGRKHIYGDPG